MEGRKKGKKEREEAKVIVFSQMITKTQHGIIRQQQWKEGGHQGVSKSGNTILPTA